MAGELATLLATELHITKLKAGEALCVVGEAADSMLPGMKNSNYSLEIKHGWLETPL